MQATTWKAIPIRQPLRQPVGPQTQNVMMTGLTVVTGEHTVEIQDLFSTLTMATVMRPIHGVQTAVNSRCIMVEDILRLIQEHLTSLALRVIWSSC